MSNYGRWTYEKGKSFKCYNNSTGWFGHIRDHKPHLYYSYGKWYVVYAGVHHDVALQQKISTRNHVAAFWCNMKNADVSRLVGNDLFWHKIHTRMLTTQQKDCP